MAVEKYIIDKSDLTALLRGECLAIQPKGQKKGFCVEIAGNLTNGDMIKAMFPNAKTWEVTRIDVHCAYIEFKDICAVKSFPLSWWNAPYKAESEEN